MEQVANVAQTTIVQDAWARDQQLHIHGLIYRLTNGRLRDLGLHVTNSDDVEAVCAEVIARL